MDCVAFTEMSLEYGRQLISTLGCQGFDLTFRGPHEDAFIGQGDPTYPHVVCGHLLSNPGPSFLNFLGTVPATSFLLLTLDRALLPVLQQAIGGHCHWKELRHRRLGGLTSARVVALWRSHSEASDASLDPSQRHSPSRPLAAFLEPSVRLSEWRMASSQCSMRARRDQTCWCPASATPVPYPWPWSTGPRWVETTSVYLGDAFIQRPLTEKELSQLLDLREAWGPPLIKSLLEWDQGASPSLRMSVEFIFLRPCNGWDWTPSMARRHQSQLQ